MSVSGFAGVVLLLSECIGCASNRSGQLDWGAFLGLISILADEMSDDGDQETYVGRVNDLVRRLRLTDAHIAKHLAATRDKLLMSPEFSRLHHSPKFEVVSIVFDKEQMIPHHDHPSMMGVLGCTSGCLKVKSYERAGKAGGAGPCLLRQTDARRLSPGQVSTLTSVRANIHTVLAEEKTQVIDIFTPSYNDDRMRSTHWYGVDSEPINPGGKMYRAVSF